MWSASSRTPRDPSLVGRSRHDLRALRRARLAFLRRFGHITHDLALLFYVDPARAAVGEEEGRPLRPLLTFMMEEFGAARERRFLIAEGSSTGPSSGPLLLRSAGEFAAAVKRACEQAQSIFIGGLPPAVAPCLEALQATGFRALVPPGGILMLAGGGWDGRHGSLVAPGPVSRSALVESAGRILGLGERQVVDVYGFTETPACFAGHFSAQDGEFLYHSPPWTRVVLRNPHTLAPVQKPDQPGLVEVLTWKAVASYPGAAVLSEDLAAWSRHTKCPVCRRQGPLFRLLGGAPAPHAVAELRDQIARL